MEGGELDALRDPKNSVQGLPRVEQVRSHDERLPAWSLHVKRGGLPYLRTVAASAVIQPYQINIFATLSRAQYPMHEGGL